MSKLIWNVPQIPQKIVAAFEWQAYYAGETHEGAYLHNGKRGYARPWTEVAIARNDLPLIFKAAYQGDIYAAFFVVIEHMIEEFSDVINNYDFGFPSNNDKTYRPGVPTWGEITDSGDLHDSLEMTINES